MLEQVEIDVQYLDNNPDLRFERTEKKEEIKITDDSLAILGNRSHPFIDAYKEAEHQQKILSTYLNPHLVHPDSRVHPRFTPLVRTGRTSCRGPNLQNLPRKENIRGIYIPTPGWVLYAADYSQLELCALAESCLKRFGFSRMAEIINSGVDLHRWFASEVASVDVEAVTDEQRQMAKACNFGFPGGLGIKKFQYLAKTSYGVSLTEEECKHLKQVWMDAFPEMEGHFKPAVDRGFSNEDEDRYMATTITGRVRRNAGYCSACNYQFQGLAADGARVALWYMWLEQYRMVNFVHDEVITELLEDSSLQYHVRRINDLMIQGMQAAIPNVMIKVEGALMRRWDKKAKPVFDEAGNLLVWKPKAA
jgi:DNA polymerase-1